ncbi:hypothetical protein ES705_20772 [subsurface metagenome]
MINLCQELHILFNNQRRFRFPFDEYIDDIPEDGVYILFEEGEKYKNLDRIVRVGSHTGVSQLRSRLKQHFEKENKDRSIFRKNIGRCILKKENHPYLKIWELDNTTRAARIQNSHLVDTEFQSKIEKQISDYIQSNLSFTSFEVQYKEERLFWERKITSTLAKSSDFSPSKNWLGHYSTKDKIRNHGLWQVNELFKEPLTEAELMELMQTVNGRL